ncbi:hypothetical protein E4U21_003819 [Claviceps maximensis]|nr:hypothetical protein E4U21_003819 [Claviceps maximensis]
MSSFLLRRATAAPAGACRSFSTSSPRSLARMTIIGRLADAPEARTASSGREVLKFTVATSHGNKENRQTSWFRITSFVEGPRKDYMLSLPKGTMMYIEGDAAMTSYQDKDGQPRSSLSIIQRNFEILKRPQPTEQSE